MKRANKLLTHLGLVLVMGTMLVACGKDNKSGRSGVNTQWGIDGLGIGTYGQVGAVSNTFAAAALAENPCKMGAFDNSTQVINPSYYPYQQQQAYSGQRFGVQFPINKPAMPVGDFYLGVTSYGDVALIVGQGPSAQPLFVGYICPRNGLAGSQGQVMPTIVTATAGTYCSGSVKPITEATMVLPGNIPLAFRWADGGVIPNLNIPQQRVKFSFCTGFQL